MRTEKQPQAYIEVATPAQLSLIHGLASLCLEQTSATNKGPKTIDDIARQPLEVVEMVTGSELEFREQYHGQHPPVSFVGEQARVVGNLARLAIMFPPDLQTQRVAREIISKTQYPQAA